MNDPREERHQESESLGAAARMLARKTRLLARIGRDGRRHDAFVREIERAYGCLVGAVRAATGDAVPDAFGDPDAAAKEVVAAMAGLRVDPDRELATGPAPRDEPNPVFLGDADAIGVPDLLHVLAVLRKSGVLLVRTEGEVFTVQIRDGAVVHACSDRAPPGERLGELLVEVGAIDQDRLDAFIHDRAAHGGRIGSALEREQLVDRDQLVAALEIQVRRLFQRMFTSRGARFEFHSRSVDEPDQRVHMSLTHLLLESARATDEIAR